MTRNAPPFPDLPSTKAALIRDLLRQKKTRDAERAFVLEGAKPILELLRANFPSLLAVVATLGAPGIGVVTCPYHGLPTETPWSRLTAWRTRTATCPSS